MMMNECLALSNRRSSTPNAVAQPIDSEHHRRDHPSVGFLESA